VVQLLKAINEIPVTGYRISLGSVGEATA